MLVSIDAHLCFTLDNAAERELFGAENIAAGLA
jgi:hypothetical protein